ncbi:DUF2726 domain-containing protein [Citrobacter braakii]|nr:DUF2726 domain-containing protein [Citrobacter braakii]
MEIIFITLVILILGFLYKKSDGADRKQNLRSDKRQTFKTAGYQKNERVKGKAESWDEVFWRLAKDGDAFSKKRFLTEREGAFFNKLIYKYGKDYSIHCQVDLGALVAPGEKYQFGSEENKILFGIVNKFCVDFVLYSRKYKEISAVIELDDKTHLQSSRIERDKKVEAILKQANIRLIRIVNIEQELIDL